jgi:hypothetical protein
MAAIGGVSAEKPHFHVWVGMGSKSWKSKKTEKSATKGETGTSQHFLGEFPVFCVFPQPHGTGRLLKLRCGLLY